MNGREPMSDHTQTLVVIPCCVILSDIYLVLAAGLAT